jgi:hypothetical protein
VPRSRQPPEEFGFLVDRSLGLHVVPSRLRAAGLQIVTLADIYGEQAAQAARDEEWLQLAGERDLVVLTNDRAIRRRTDERATVERFGVRVFCVAGSPMTGEETAERLLTNRHRIVQRSRRPGSWICHVYATSIEQKWP